MADEDRSSKKYKPELETDFEWVTKDPNGKELAFCTACEVTITPTSSCLLTHSSSWRHQKNNYDIKTTGKKNLLKGIKRVGGSSWKKDYDLSRKFRDEWLLQFPWVKKKDERLGYCPYCDIDLEPRAKRFEDHQNTAKHQKNLTNPNVLLQKEKEEIESTKDFDKIGDFTQLMSDLPTLLDREESKRSTEKQRKSSRKRKKKVMFDEIEGSRSKQNKRVKKVFAASGSEFASQFSQATANAWSLEFPWVVMDDNEQNFPFCPYCNEYIEPSSSSLQRHQELMKHRKRSSQQVLLENDVTDDLDQTVLAEDPSTEIHTTVVVPAGTIIQSELGMNVMNQTSFFPISESNDQYVEIIIQDNQNGDSQNTNELVNSIKVEHPSITSSEENKESTAPTNFEFKVESENIDEENTTKPLKKRKSQIGKHLRHVKNMEDESYESDEDFQSGDDEGPPKKRFTRQSIRRRKSSSRQSEGENDELKFLSEWLEEYPWVRKKIVNDKEAAYCSYCCINVPAKAVRLRLHEQTFKHKKNADITSARRIISSDEKSPSERIEKITTTRKVEARPRYECDVCNRRFVAQRNLYFHMKEHYEPENELIVQSNPSYIDVIEKRDIQQQNSLSTSDSSFAKTDEYDPKWQKIFPWLMKAEDNDWAFCVICSVPMEPRLHVIKAHMKHRRHRRSVLQQSNPGLYEMKDDDDGILEAEEQRLSRRKKSSVSAVGETFIGEDGKAKIRCPTCTKVLVKTSFAVHWRIHEGVRPYKCSQCEWAFKQAYDLKHHVESIHNGIRPHQCEECGKEFTRKYTLQLHQKIHNGNKSHKCDVCQKGFITKSKLIEHRRIHTGERPFLCDYCGRSFRIKFDMMTHKQKAHVGVDLPKKDKLGSQSANEPVFSAEDQEVEDDAPETDSVITHYVQLKEGEVSMELSHENTIEVEVEDQQVHGFDEFEEVDIEQKHQLVFISENEAVFLSR